MSFFPDTAWLFDAMVSSERRLAESGAFGSDAQAGDFSSFFIPRRGVDLNQGFIEDDHIPFMKKGVSVLHIIASPFPRVWHTIKVSLCCTSLHTFTLECLLLSQDDASALDAETMRRWNMIMRVFMAEYLGLVPESTRADFSRHLVDELVSCIIRYILNRLDLLVDLTSTSRRLPPSCAELKMTGQTFLPFAALNEHEQSFRDPLHVKLGFLTLELLKDRQHIDWVAHLDILSITG